MRQSHGAAALGEAALVGQRAIEAPAERIDPLVERGVLEASDIMIELLGPLDPVERDIVGVDETGMGDRLGALPPGIVEPELPLHLLRAERDPSVKDEAGERIDPGPD